MDNPKSTEVANYKWVYVPTKENPSMWYVHRASEYGRRGSRSNIYGLIIGREEDGQKYYELHDQPKFESDKLVVLQEAVLKRCVSWESAIKEMTAFLSDKHVNGPADWDDHVPNPTDW